MKITKRELKQMINESVREVLNESVDEFDYRFGQEMGFKKCELDGSWENIVQDMPLNSYNVIKRGSETIVFVKCKETGKEWSKESIERSRKDPSLLGVKKRY